MVTNAISDMLRQKESPTRSRIKVLQKDKLRYWRSLHNWVVSQFLSEKVYSTWKIWDQNTPSNSPKGTWHQIKIRERKGPSRGIIQKCAPHERSPYAPKFDERSHEETLHQEGCARRVAWNLAKNIYKLKNSDKTTFYVPGERKSNVDTYHITETRRARIRSRFRSIDAHAKQKKIKLRRDGHSKKSSETLQ